jgi:hypothetical protein
MQLRLARTWLWIACVLYFGYLMLLITIPYLSFRLDVDFLITKQRIIHLKHWRYAFYLHVLSSLFVLLAGATQFTNYFLRKHKKVHQLVGKMYVYIILFISGPGALVISFYANGDVIAKTSFVILSLLWILFTALSFFYVLKKDFVKHRAFMIRSYALTFSAVTLRLYAFVLPHVIHLEAKEEYALIAWASWTINLLAAEGIIYFTRNKPVIS